MFTIVEGYQGSGKTLYVVRSVIREVDHKRPAARIFANLHIEHDNAERVDWVDLLDPAAPPGIKILDEAARAWDSRRSMSHAMSMLSASTEERKNGRDVWMTTQLLGMLDSRIRNMADRVVRIKGLFPTRRRYDRETDEIIRREHPRLIRIETWRGPDGQKKDPQLRRSKVTLPWLLFAPYVNRYDTTETIGLADHLAAGKDSYRDIREQRAQLARAGTAAARRVAP